jgi:hypothetical protein
MTAQFNEHLRYQGEEYPLSSLPLSDYFLLTGKPSPFSGHWCTALWRGYVGTWEITHDRLYLVGLSGRLADDTEVDMSLLFPEYPQRAFAHWFSGVLRVPQGELLQYVHMGFASVYEQELCFEVERGMVRRTWIERHERPDPTPQANEDAQPSRKESGA